MNVKRHIEHTSDSTDTTPRFFNAAVSVLLEWFYLALGGISLLALLPFIVISKLVRKKGEWI